MAYHNSTEFRFQRGCVVWGRLKTSTQYWPGMVVRGFDIGMRECSEDCYWVFWFDIKCASKVKSNNVFDFIPYYRAMYQSYIGIENYYKGVASALSVCQTQGYFDKKTGNLAKNYLSTRDFGVPLFIYIELDYLKQNVLHKDFYDCENSRLYEPNYMTKQDILEAPLHHKQLYIEVKEKLMTKLIQLSEICISCKKYIQNIAHKRHPCFDGNCCERCFERIKYTMYTTGGNNVHVYCAVCAYKGELFVCKNKNCCRGFCLQCIQIFWGSNVESFIENSETWFCSLCVESKKNDTIKRNNYWPINVLNLFQTPKGKIMKPMKLKKNKLRVLSLFDGISAGLIALEKLGFELEVYYTCEIDESALAVSHNRHGFKCYFKNLGSIESLTSQEFAGLGRIDLLIGGSPCNDLSLVNPARKGLLDANGTGFYFFDFMRILLKCQYKSEVYPFFWLFENVAAMPKKFIYNISRFLQCEPTLVNAKYYSPQVRARLFWGNIPGLTTIDSNTPFLPEINVNSCLDNQIGRKAVVDKVNTITTNPNSLRQGKFNTLPIKVNGIPDTLWITEIEKIFGFPVHYTDVANLSVRQRQTLLGRSWSIPVICQILLPLRNFFILKED